MFNGRYLSIDSWSTARVANVGLDDCHINDSQAKCQGKNQQWIVNTSDQTIISQMDETW
jgi:hypothetical protein